MITSLIISLFVSAHPKVGQQAPDFSVRDTEDNTLQLSNLVEQGPVILVFFPKAFTPSWRNQLTAFQAGYANLKDSNVSVLAISNDNSETLRRFKKDLNADFHFIPDTNSQLTKLYGVKYPIFSIAKRYTFVINQNKIITNVYHGASAMNPLKTIAAVCEKTKT